VKRDKRDIRIKKQQSTGISLQTVKYMYSWT